MLIEAWPPTALELGSSSAKVGRGEGWTVKPVRQSPRLERRCDGQATMTNQRRQRVSEVVMLALREEGRRAGMGAARIGRGPQPFIGAGGRRRWRRRAASMAGHDGVGYTQRRGGFMTK
jgi:hypothetical protein